MRTEEGYIDICQMLGIENKPYLNTPDLYNELLSKLEKVNGVSILKNRQGTNLVINFIYENESYFFNFDSRVEDPFTNLVYEEVCQDLNIRALNYDVASIGNLVGNISEDYRKKDAQYISGYDLLKNSSIYKSENDESVLAPSPYSAFGEGEELGSVLRRYNTLESIWASLEITFQKRPDMQDVVKRLMNQIVDMFIVDILLGNTDRNNTNWEIEITKDDDINLAPIYDNARALLVHPLMVGMQLTVETRTGYFDPGMLEDNLIKFLKISSKEYADRLINSLWVLSYDNLLKIIQRIETKIGREIPSKVKINLLQKFRIHSEIINEIIEDYNLKSNFIKN